MADEQPGDRTVIRERRTTRNGRSPEVAEKDDANQRRAQEFNYNAEKANQGQCLTAHHPDGPDATAGGHGASEAGGRGLTSPFHGEGYRKVRARLANWGLAVGGKRVLRLMRQHGLLAPRLLGPPNGDPAHAGQIIADRPDVIWGTDATCFYTEQDGWC